MSGKATGGRRLELGPHHPKYLSFGRIRNFKNSRNTHRTNHSVAALLLQPNNGSSLHVSTTCSWPMGHLVLPCDLCRPSPSLSAAGWGVGRSHAEAQRAYPDRQPLGKLPLPRGWTERVLRSRASVSLSLSVPPKTRRERQTGLLLYRSSKSRRFDRPFPALSLHTRLMVWFTQRRHALKRRLWSQSFLLAAALSTPFCVPPRPSIHRLPPPCQSRCFDPRASLT